MSFEPRTRLPSVPVPLVASAGWLGCFATIAATIAAAPAIRPRRLKRVSVSGSVVVPAFPAGCASMLRLPSLEGRVINLLHGSEAHRQRGSHRMFARLASMELPAAVVAFAKSLHHNARHRIADLN